jgi:hypothetical protein
VIFRVNRTDADHVAPAAIDPLFPVVKLVNLNALLVLNIIFLTVSIEVNNFYCTVNPTEVNCRKPQVLSLSFLAVTEVSHDSKENDDAVRTLSVTYT